MKTFWTILILFTVPLGIPLFAAIDWLINRLGYWYHYVLWNKPGNLGFHCTPYHHMLLLELCYLIENLNSEFYFHFSRSIKDEIKR